MARGPGTRTGHCKNIVEEAETAGTARLSSKTIQRHLSALIGLFRYAKEHGRYEADNPRVWLPLPPHPGARETSGPLGPQSSSKRCSARRSGRGRKSSGITDTTCLCWGLMAGCALRKPVSSNSRTSGSEDGIAFLDIRPGDGKQLKSRAAVRRVPVHPVLYRGGGPGAC